MRLLDNLLGKKTPGHAIRERFKKSFDDTVKFVFKENGTSGNPMLDGLRVQASITSVYQTFKGNQELTMLCSTKDIDYNKILDEKCSFVLNRYLENDQ